MKTKGIVLLIIAVAIVFVATCFAIAFAIGRKVDVVNGSITASGDNLSGVARINDDDLGFVNIEWILQEKETSAETTTYVARITAIFTPGKAAIKAGENYGKWGCKSGYLHVLPACVNNDKITFVSATPIDIDDETMTFSSQKGANNPNTYQWSFIYNEKSNETFVLPVVYEFSANKSVDVTELSLKIGVSMSVCRGFTNRAITNSIDTANI